TRSTRRTRHSNVERKNLNNQPNRRLCARLALVLAVTIPVTSALAQDSSLVRLLKSGRVPEERQGPVLEMIAKPGTAADLRYIFGRALESDKPGGPFQILALEALCEAARNRRLRPEGDLSIVAQLLDKENTEIATRERAVQLVGLWEI